MRPSILLAPASGPGVGGGHVMRGLALARALAARGAVCAFVCGPQGAEIVARYGGGRFSAHGLDLSVEALASIGEGAGLFDALIIDDYNRGAVDEAALRPGFRAIMVIDDLADRPHDCDLLLDPGYGRAASDYAALAPAYAQILAGPQYALLRGEFAGLRTHALARPRPQRVERLFVNFGLSDVDAVAARVYDALREALVGVRVDLIVAQDAPSLPSLRGWARSDRTLALHIDSPSVGELMAQADAAIGAGGASTWERACLALPTLAIIVADNQRRMIERLAADGALLSVDLESPDFELDLRQAFAQLSDLTLRARIAGRAAALCDGQGADRAADALLGRLEVRP